MPKIGICPTLTSLHLKFLRKFPSDQAVYKLPPEI